MGRWCVLLLGAGLIASCGEPAARGLPARRLAAERSQPAQPAQAAASSAARPLPAAAVLTREASLAATSTALPAGHAQLVLELPEIDRHVRDALAEHKLPGAVVVVGRGDGVVWQRAYGQRALVPEREAMTADTVFDLASLTKSVATTTVVMALIEEGKLSLDTRVHELLPEVLPAARGVTVRHLLLHTSGLPAVTPLRDFEGTPAEVRARVLRVRPRGKPGTRYHYSDIGFIWLGELASRAAGEPFDALVSRVLLEPLAMRDTGYRPAADLHARIAPTEHTNHRGGGVIRGEVHDPRAYRMGGVAGNAGLFSSAADLARFARMLLRGGELDGKRVLRTDTVGLITQRHAVDDSTQRTLGWDVQSAHSRARGRELSASAFGHGGYTGTSLWIDPEQDLFVLLLSNRVHPSATGDVIELMARITDAAVQGVVRSPGCPTAGQQVLTGIDVLRAQGLEPLHGKAIALLTHRAARARDGTSTLDVLAGAEGVRLVRVLTPEHGLDADREGVIASGQLGAVPVHSLFGPTRRPTPAMLDGVDALVVDLVDVGTRFYTYASTLREALIAASAQRVPVWILDRPNPLGGEVVEGPPLDADLRSFVNHHALPLRHGLTLGELGLLFARDLDLSADIELVAASGWHRAQLFTDTGLSWTPPSPNLRSSTGALLYPAVGLLEGTVLSVGRGTDTPFELVGAPFVDAAALTAALERTALPGVVFEPATFTPSAGPFAGETCYGVRIRVENAAPVSAARTGLALAAQLIALHGDSWQRDRLVKLVGHRATVRGLESGTPFEALAEAWQPEMRELLDRRGRVLRYPSCRAQASPAPSLVAAAP